MKSRNLNAEISKVINELKSGKLKLETVTVRRFTDGIQDQEAHRNDNKNEAQHA